MRRTAFLLAAALFLAGGCSRDRTLICRDTSERYSGAQSVAPLSIPDELTVPDETEALRIPDPVTEDRTEGIPCLDAPPDFFDEDAAG